MATEKDNIYKKLLAIQTELKAPKNRKNTYGNYMYRNCEDIQEAAKHVCKKYGLLPLLSDEVIVREGVFFVEATAKVIDVDSEKEVCVKAWAEIDRGKKGQDSPQQTGTASSYARKYALNGLYQLDDTKDSDNDEHKQEQQARQAQATSKQAGTKKQDEAPEMPTKEEIEQFRAYLEAEGISEEYVCYSCGIKNITMITKKLFDKFADNKNLPALKEAHEKWLKEQEAKKNE